MSKAQRSLGLQVTDWSMNGKHLGKMFFFFFLATAL